MLGPLPQISLLILKPNPGLGYLSLFPGCPLLDVPVSFASLIIGPTGTYRFLCACWPSLFGVRNLKAGHIEQCFPAKNFPSVGDAGHLPPAHNIQSGTTDEISTLEVPGIGQRKGLGQLSKEVELLLRVIDSKRK